ncbi:hypothetical protein [Sideroxydans sp. CL21]|uniref:hypothetical protein n=1 Tax=Sideroxydans sp. CL21 TaxID=2600596 RepID=UPI0012A80BA2|nr:hypothetical protein [Sideroxydans sp. CL21]VVC83098.1 hypothetical protein [Sideroxydans sp. CL21]
MNRFLWITSRWVKNLGLTGMAGMALVAFSLAGYLSMILLEHSKLEQLTQDVAEERKRLEMARLNPEEDTYSAGGQLHAFYEFFPVRQKAPNLFKAIYSAAHDESISLSQGEYKYSLGKSGRMGIYEVNLPVQGSYIQIRKFIVKVLNSVPSAALEEVSFRREAVGKGDLEAKIRFSIYLSVI